MTIIEAARALRARECTVRELWDACATVAHAKNPKLNAYLEIFDADSSAIAAAQNRIDTEGERAPLLCGIPLAIKDNILIEGKIASAASKMLENYRATYDATVVKKLKDAGALFLGRTNMDEFAMDSSTEHSAFGTTKNPHDTSRVPGGSSGGSAAAVAAHLAIAALGSDTGGSVRQPASHTGIVGLKPTYGAVSRSGLIAMGSSLDQVGPLTKTVEDARILYDVIRGKDILDSTTIPEGLFPARHVPKQVRIGVPRHLLGEGVDAGVREVFDAMLEQLARAGHTLVDVELPMSSHALAAYYVIMPAEVSTNLARLDGIRYGHAARGKRFLKIIFFREQRASAKRRAAASCSAHSYSPRVTLTRITARRTPRVPYCAKNMQTPLKKLMSSPSQRRRLRHFYSARRATRSLCILKTYSP